MLGCLPDPMSLHYTVSDNAYVRLGLGTRLVETYLQEIGRAGRDSRPAYANLYYGGRNRYADNNILCE